MLYLGIDQHKRQLTVNLRNEDGTVILQRQVRRIPQKSEKCLICLIWGSWGRVSASAANEARGDGVVLCRAGDDSSNGVAVVDRGLGRSADERASRYTDDQMKILGTVTTGFRDRLQCLVAAFRDLTEVATVTSKAAAA